MASDQASKAREAVNICWNMSASEDALVRRPTLPGIMRGAAADFERCLAGGGADRGTVPPTSQWNCW